MFFKTNTEEKVNLLLKESAARKSKIKESIKLVDTQIDELQNKISSLIDKYVSLEIEGNADGIEDIDKSINAIRQQIESLKGKKEAYLRLTDQDKFIKNAVPKIIESAGKDRKERIKKLERKIQEKNKLEEQIKQIEQQLKVVENEINIFQSEKEVQQVKKILKYIEPRKIKYLCEESYISVLLDDGGEEYLEQYIEPELRKNDISTLEHNSIPMNKNAVVKVHNVEKKSKNLILDQTIYNPRKEIEKALIKVKQLTDFEIDENKVRKIILDKFRLYMKKTALEPSEKIQDSIVKELVKDLKSNLIERNM